MFFQNVIVSNSPESTFFLKTNTKEMIIQKVSVVSYSSSSPGVECIAFEGELGRYLNTTVTDKGDCFTMFYPFTTMEPREDPMHKGLESIVAADESMEKYEQYSKRVQDAWEVDPEAPFAHRIKGSLNRVKEEDLMEAIYEHKRRDKIFDLSEGITLKRFGLESSTGDEPVRFTICIWGIPIGKEESF